MTPDALLHFWFDETDPALWWKRDAAFDTLLQQRFGTLHAAACRCELDHWRSTPRGRLAEIIVLDQFSRNIHRDTARAFANDGLALALAQEAVAAHAQYSLSAVRKSFLYLPFMHSESALMHERAVQLYAEPGLESNLEFEYQHKSIIDRFGRYPHRNAVLGRASTPEEAGFLLEAGSSF